MQVVYCSPLCTAPWTRPATRWKMRGLQTIEIYMPGRMSIMESLLQLNMVGARLSRAAPGRSGSFLPLILFFACLLSCALASQSSLYTLFFAGLQVEGVALDLLDNVFLLHLALEAA